MSTFQRGLIDMPKKTRYLRERNEITQKDLAKLIKISQNQISEIENGGRPFTLKTIMSYTDYFGINIDEFLFDDFETFKNNEEKLMGVME